MHARANVDRTQLLHLGKSLRADHLEGAGQRDVLQRRVNEGALSDVRQLRGVGIVILEGDLYEGLVSEGIIVDFAHGRRNPHLRQMRVGESAGANLGHALGDAYLAGTTGVAHEHAVGVDDEAVGVCAQRGGSVSLPGGVSTDRMGSRRAKRSQRQGAGKRKRQHREL